MSKLFENVSRTVPAVSNAKAPGVLMGVCQQLVIMNLLGGEGAGVAAVVIVRVSETAQKTAHGWIVVGVVNRVELVLRLVRIAHVSAEIDGRRMCRQAVVTGERI